MVEWRYGVRHGMIGQHVSQVRQAGGLCVAAHPRAPYPGGVFMYPFEGFDAVEVWNGLWSSSRPWNANNAAATAEWGWALVSGAHGGRWLPAVGSSDTHLRGQIAVPHTVVLADRLTAGAVLAGIRAGTSWIAGSAAVSLSLHVHAGSRSAGIGERLEASGEAVTVRVVVGGVPSGTVSFHTDHGTVCREPLSARKTERRRMAHQRGDSLFVRVEVHHPRTANGSTHQPGLLVLRPLPRRRIRRQRPGAVRTGERRPHPERGCGR